MYKVTIANFLIQAFFKCETYELSVEKHTTDDSEEQREKKQIGREKRKLSWREHNTAKHS